MTPTYNCSTTRNRPLKFICLIYLSTVLNNLYEILFENIYKLKMFININKRGSHQKMFKIERSL